MTRDSDVSAARALAPEALVRIRVNGSATLELSCTPADLRTLMVGWLVCEGVAADLTEIDDIAVEPPGPGYAAGLAVRLAREAWGRMQAALAPDAGRAVRPATLDRPDRAAPPPVRPGAPDLRPLLEDRALLASWFKDMFDGAELRSSVGGVHTGGLVVNGSLERVVEDVSRHHVVDRLVGSAVLAGAAPHDCLLLVSARISGAMAAKACRSGVGAIVSRSVPTELAASVARSKGLVLVGRAQREAPLYYWPEPEPAGE